MRFAADGARVAGAVMLGALTAPAGLLFLLGSAPFAKSTAAAARWLARLEVRRLRLDPALLRTGSRVRLFLAARAPLGLLGALVLAMTGFGAWHAARLVWAWLRGEPYDGMPASLPLAVYLFTAGGALRFLARSEEGRVGEER